MYDFKARNSSISLRASKPIDFFTSLNIIWLIIGSFQPWYYKLQCDIFNRFIHFVCFLGHEMFQQLQFCYMGTPAHSPLKHGLDVLKHNVNAYDVQHAHRNSIIGILK